MILSYDVDIAKAFNINVSIFISCINMFKTFGQFSDNKVALNRSMIYDISGLTDEVQQGIENELIESGILTMKQLRGPSDKNYYIIDYDKLSCIKDNPNKQINMFTFSTTTKQNTKQSVKEKVSKKEQTLRKLKLCVSYDDPVIVQYLYDWIDSIIEKGGFLTTQGVKINVNELKAFTNNQSIAIKVITLATKNSWRDLSWAMDRIKKEQFSNNSNNFSNYLDIISSTNDSDLSEAF